MHEGHEPYFLADLLDADILSGEDLTEIDFSAADANAITGGDRDRAIMQRVGQFAYTLIGPRRRAAL